MPEATDSVHSFEPSAPAFAEPGPSHAISRILGGGGSENIPCRTGKKCVVCSIIVSDDRQVKLSENKLLFLLLNGERSTAALPLITMECIICQECCETKLSCLQKMWVELSSLKQREDESLNDYGRRRISQLLSRISPTPLGSPMDIFDTNLNSSQSEGTETESDESSSRSDQIISDSETDSEGEEKRSGDSREHETSLQSDGSGESSSGSEKENSDNFLPTTYFEVPISCILRSQKHCFVCKCKTGRLRVPKETRIQVWDTLKLYIDSGKRLCQKHLVENTNMLKLEELTIISRIRANKVTLFTIGTFQEFLSDIVQPCGTVGSSTQLSFSSEQAFNDDDYYCFFGVNKTQFGEIMGYCSSDLRSTVRKVRDLLAIFLMKIRLNLSQKVLGKLFGLSQSAVCKALSRIRTALKEKFVPLHLGYSHITKDEFIRHHTTLIAKRLTGADETQAIFVIDGTYLYIQKSANFEVQRRTYSGHKFRNLLKAMMIVSSSGYILAVEGPYFADGKNNDASIFANMLRNKQGVRTFITNGDFIIEDRSFRDCNELLSGLGYSVLMPHFLKKGQKQHTTLQANESRLVTKLRWIVESVNGRIKNVFRFFRDVIPNSYMKKNAVWEIFEIACAILNAYHPPLKTDSEEDAIFAEHMIQRVDMSNLLHDRLDLERHLRMTKEWLPLAKESLSDFPRLILSDLRMLTYGVYQIKLAPSYLAESYEMFYHPTLAEAGIRFKIHSRMQTSKTHALWIGYDPRENSYKGITGWYCMCKVGSRIVGQCAHVAAIVWYLGYARYLQKIIIPSKNISKDVRDASTFTYEEEFVDEDDSDSFLNSIEFDSAEETGSDENEEQSNV